MQIFDYIAQILSILIRPIYGVVNNYGWTIIIVTIIIKLLTLPFTVKSQKSMAKMQQVQPLISEIQKKYAKNNEKMQAEMMKIYDKYDISPTGGCMPLLVQMIILMGFIQVVYKPVTFILGIPKAAITAAAEELGIQSTQFVSNQLGIFSNPELLNKLGLDAASLNFDFLGIDLTKVLKDNLTNPVLWILPILALAFSILSTYVSQKQATNRQNPNAKDDAQAAQAQAMTKSMYIMMPLMTIWITFSWPLGCALYWTISTVTQIAQKMFINKFIVDNMDPIDLTKKKTKKKRVPSKKELEIRADFGEVPENAIEEGENQSEND